MMSRTAEIIGGVAIVVIGFTAVAALTYDTVGRSAAQRGPIHHNSPGGVGTALEDGYTAQLALAQFPLPVSENARDRTKQQLVLALQRELSARGFDAGPADGVVHPETRAAIRDYETSSGLDVTGEPTPNLLEHIMATRDFGDAVVSPEQQEKRELVVRVQRRLIELGYSPGPDDGIVTGAMREAIAAFESDHGLPPTGDLSPRVIRELGSESAEARY